MKNHFCKVGTVRPRLKATEDLIEKENDSNKTKTKKKESISNLGK